MIRNEKLILVVVVFIIITVAIASTAYVYTSGFISLDKNNSDEDDKFTDYDYYQLLYDYNDLVDDYDSLYDNYDELQDDYDTLEENCGTSIVYADSNPPSTVIKNGSIYWNFYTLDSSVSTWNVPVETYRSYITYPKPILDYLYLNNDGETITTYDLRDYIQPELFSKVITYLTDGRTAKEFVNEVVNLKNQLISYGSLESSGEYRWAMETLTEGQGNCGDTTILIASLLKAGEEEKNYGIDVYIWYCDSDDMTNPKKVNHVIVGVEYNNGDSELIETTSDTYYAYSQIKGWKYEV